MDGIRATPKRKRSGVTAQETPSLGIDTSFSLGVHPPSSPEDGNASPRTKVAHHFRALALQGGGGVTDSGPDPGQDAMHDDKHASPRKRARLPVSIDNVSTDACAGSEAYTSIQEGLEARKPTVATLGQALEKTPGTVATAAANPPEDDDDKTARQTAAAASPAQSTEAVQQQSSARPRTRPFNRPAADKPRRRRRAGTPPLAAASASAAAAATALVADPVRAALTWHDDEITVYDPDDSDDDGTGVNGVGFKPTPAVARARALKRRQQLAEYRKREEREARARRSQRRRGSPAAPAPAPVEVRRRRATRKVRFLEGVQNGAVGAG